MKSSGLEAFEFGEEDHLPDVAAAKFLKKFKNPDSEVVAVQKHDFLGCVDQETSIEREVVVNTPCVHTDAINCDKNPYNGISTISLSTTGDDFAISLGNSGLDAAPQSNSTNHEQRPYDKLDNHESKSILTELETRVSSLGPPSPRKNPISPISDSPSRVEPVHMFPNADECMRERTMSSPSDSAEDGVSLTGWVSDHFSGGLEMNQSNLTVLLQPDYVSYRDNYCTETLLTFSDSYIKAKGLGNHGTFDFEWGIDDILDIECRWIQGVDTVLMKLHVVSKDAVPTDNANGNSGIEELKFSVVHPNWARKQEQITSLNDKYLAIWDVVAEEDMDGDAIPGRCYFPSFDEPFEEVVYPKGDVDAVSISKRDVDLLQPETFINDTIIDFYIKYLKNQIQSEERHRFHFFNSFFFRKLADLDKDPSSASDGRAAFLRVRKWTRKMDLFKKDYIFIPVNFNLHWSLIVICHPGEVVTFQDDDLDKLHRVPCILHMDSIKGSHSGLKNLVQSYLWEEWKERQMETSEQICSKFLNLRFVELELPQQENSFDCGLFLLHYLELFLAEAPVRFNPFKIDKFSAFLNMDWFPPVEASLKRALIQKLIYDLLMNRSRENSSSACSDEDLPSRFPENNGKETCVEFLSERCNPGVSSHVNFISSQAGEGIEMTLLSTSSMRSSECVNDSGLVLRDLFESGTTAGSLLGQYESYQGSSFYHLKGGMSLVEEDADTEEDLVLLPSEEAAFGQMGRLTSQDCSILQSSRGFTSNTDWDPSISTQAKHEDVNLSPKTSDCCPDDDIGIIEHCSIGKDVDLSREEEKDRRKSPSMENYEDASDSFANAVEGSQVLDKIHANDGDATVPNAVEGLLLDLYKIRADDGDVTGSLTNVVEGSQDVEKIHFDDGDHLPSKDPDSSETIETSIIRGVTESSQDLDKIHAEGGDHVLFKDPVSEMAKTSITEGAIECSQDLDEAQAKEGHHLPHEDPDSSKMAETSTVEDSLDIDKIANNRENGDHLLDSDTLHVSSPHRPDLVDSKLDEQNSQPEKTNDDDDDDDAELCVQQSGKRSNVSDLQEEEAAKRMRIAPPNEVDMAAESVIQSDELHL